MSEGPGRDARRADFPHLAPIQTRWMDNDVYGHVNNVVYYSFFDTAVNGYLIGAGVLDIARGAVIGLAVESKCTFFREITYPETVIAGLCVGRIGTSSVRYEIGLFREDDEAPAATGYFVHVYVDRESRRPVPVPEAMRTVLERLLLG